MVSKTYFDVMAERRARHLAERRGWIGVDLDGTLFEYHDWVAWNVFGSPIMPMVYRVRRWLSEGHDVRVLTARIGLPERLVASHGVSPVAVYSREPTQLCRVASVPYSNWDMEQAIKRHCGEHIGAMLPVQCFKDCDMIELWDDRVVQVESNTGRTVFDEFEAEVAALGGSP